MADFTATAVPQDVAGVIGAPRNLALRFRVTNTDADARLFMREAATAPAGAERGITVQPGGWFEFRVFADGPAPASFGWWAWTDAAACGCVVTEVFD
ncbi:MAG: hypothetical protein OXF93_02170 [Acidobacteria bacterium]|nr:hypothetical protein [Acidobacteriota bacterium]